MARRFPKGLRAKNFPGWKRCTCSLAECTIISKLLEDGSLIIVYMEMGTYWRISKTHPNLTHVKLGVAWSETELIAKLTQLGVY